MTDFPESKISITTKDLLFFPVTLWKLFHEYKMLKNFYITRTSYINDAEKNGKIPASLLFAIDRQLQEIYTDLKVRQEGLKGATIYLPYSHKGKKYLVYLAMYPDGSYKNKSLKHCISDGTSAGKAYYNYDSSHGMQENNKIANNSVNSDHLMNIVLETKDQNDTKKPVGLLQFISTHPFSIEEWSFQNNRANKNNKNEKIELSENLSDLVYKFYKTSQSETLQENLGIIFPPENNAIVMFCDITNSTSVLDASGIDVLTEQSISFTQMAERIVKKYDGVRVGSVQGDGLWFGFPKTINGMEKKETELFERVRKAAEEIKSTFDNADKGYSYNSKYIHISMWYGHIFSKIHGTLFDATVEFYGEPFIKAHKAMENLERDKNSIIFGNVNTNN